MSRQGARTRGVPHVCVLAAHTSVVFERLDTLWGGRRYVRIIAGLAAFWYCDEWKLFFWCYWVSYFLDCFDGAAARKFNQATRFGQMLDMVLAAPVRGLTPI